MAKSIEKAIEKKEVVKPTVTETPKKKKEGVTVSVTSNGGVGFLVTERGVDGSIHQYKSEKDPTSENK